MEIRQSDIEIQDEFITKILKDRYLSYKTVIDKDFYTKESSLITIKEQESIIDMVDRVANTSTKDKLEQKKIKTAISNCEFMPSTPILMNCGIYDKATMSACFLFEVPDSIKGIFDTATKAAIVTKDGGGTGFVFGDIRPAGSNVGEVKKAATGPISFMEVYDKITDVVKQGNRRRGANIGVLRIDHPDILEFIKCKSDGESLQNFNLSVAITDEFMKAVENDTEIELQFKEYKKPIKAKIIWDEICKNAWKKGDPGILFIDTANEYNIAKEYKQFKGTNPCGEILLFDNEACLLSSINLDKFVDIVDVLDNDNNVFFDNINVDISSDKIYMIHNYYGENVKFRINVKELKNTAKLVTRFLDSIIDIQGYPVEDIEKATKYTRKLGIGIMGFADLLIRLKIIYGSQESIFLAELLMKIINMAAREESTRLGDEFGYAPIFDDYELCHRRRRNLTLTTIAPTGSISMIAKCSSGIEPIFSLAYKRQTKNYDWDIIHKYFKQYVADKYNIPLENVTNEQCLKIIEDGNYPSYFITAHDVPYENHIKIQAAFQKHVDSSISKTINLPNSATINDVENAYKLAYNLKCKGITIFRDGCRDFQVLEQIKDKKDTRINPQDRGGETYGVKKRFKYGNSNNLYVYLGENNKQELIEIFINLGKSGSNINCLLEALGRSISLNFKSGIKVTSIVKNLKGIISDTPIYDEGKIYKSIPDVIGNLIEEWFDSEDIDNEDIIGCPECGGNLIHVENCVKCMTCGFNKCG